MAKVLLTAFGPYESWPTNASWEAVVELTRDLPAEPSVTTRLYPVDYAAVRDKLERDLSDQYDFALLMGQAPGASDIRLEAIGINVQGPPDSAGNDCLPLVESGPLAYRSALPLAKWARRLRGIGIPARVSYHAGTYLCNASLYLAHYFADQMALKTQAAFIHVPLSTTQAATATNASSSLPSPLVAQAVLAILAELRGK